MGNNINTKHLIEIDLHDAKKSIEDICIMGAINTDEKGKEILSSLNCYLQKIWEDVSHKHLDQLKNDKLKEDNALLIDALKEIIELFPNEPKLPISHQVLDISKSVLQKVENK